MITYLDSPARLSPAQITGFFVGWPNAPSPEVHLKILEQSHAVYIAIDRETGRVVGFINAITDGILSAYIPLLEVLPEYQGRGIGSELVRRMLDRLNGLYMVDLLCDVSVQPFYERLGLLCADGMTRRNFAVQNGGHFR